MATVNLASVGKVYAGTEVLSDISLQIDSGEFVVFVGPSGCGKSTLLKLIAGLESPTSGVIDIEGRDVTGLEPVERGIAMVFQSYALYPHLSVFENIAFPLRIQKLPKEAVNQRVNAAAEVLNLTDRLKYKPGELSGGQRQRVAIGRAIVRDPKVFLFDEPLSNLDASLRGTMRVELSELHQRLKTTMIYVTHDQVEAMTMADRIVVLNDGQVEQFGTPMALYNEPQTRFVAGFIGQPGMNFIPSIIAAVSDQSIDVQTQSGTLVTLPLQADSSQVGTPVELGIRPEHIALSRTATAPQNTATLPVATRIVERLGGVSLLYGNLADGTSLCASLDGQVDMNTGSDVMLTFDPANAFVFDSDGRALQRQTD